MPCTGIPFNFSAWMCVVCSSMWRNHVETKFFLVYFLFETACHLYSLDFWFDFWLNALCDVPLFDWQMSIFHTVAYIYNQVAKLRFIWRFIHRKHYTHFTFIRCILSAKATHVANFINYPWLIHWHGQVWNFSPNGAILSAAAIFERSFRKWNGGEEKYTIIK